MTHQRIGKGSTKGGYLVPELNFRASKAVRAGQSVFLTGATGLSLDGKSFVGEGDPAAQADNAMRCVKVLLEEAGARMQNICKVTTYVTKHSYRKDVYPVLARHLKGVNPVSTGLVVTGLARPELDFEIDVFAVVPEAGQEHRRFGLTNLNRPESTDLAFSDLDYGLARAVRAGDLVFLQGQTGRTPDGGFVGKGDVAAQAGNAMRCVKDLLEEAGARMEDICKVITYVKNVSDRQLVYPVLARHLEGVSPVSTGLVIEDFGHPDVDFEIDVFTVIPEERSSQQST
jgi:enamine deaminase RidA (YjgF/YER057c/UK114 family)